ncbi:MAG: hypothetical protein ACJ768_01740 [Gaiellaceae bacterium]
MIVSKDVVRIACEVCDDPDALTVPNLERWVLQGLLGPFRRHRQERGNPRDFGRVELVLAVVAGCRYRQEGAGADRVQGVVKLIASRPWELLEADLDAGRTFPVTEAMVERVAGEEGIRVPAVKRIGWMIEPPPAETLSPGAAELLRKVDLAELLKVVRAEVDRLTGGEPRKKGGRSHRTKVKAKASKGR